MKGEVKEEVPEEGARIGRYVLLRNVEGHLHAIAATALIIASDAEGAIRSSSCQLPDRSASPSHSRRSWGGSRAVDKGKRPAVS
jgi:hypothetical protein